MWLSSVLWHCRQCTLLSVLKMSWRAASKRLCRSPLSWLRDCYFKFNGVIQSNCIFQFAWLSTMAAVFYCTLLSLQKKSPSSASCDIKSDLMGRSYLLYIPLQRASAQVCSVHLNYSDKVVFEQWYADFCYFFVFFCFFLMFFRIT